MRNSSQLTCQDVASTSIGKLELSVLHRTLVLSIKFKILHEHAFINSNTLFQTDSRYSIMENKHLDYDNLRWKVLVAIISHPMRQEITKPYNLG